MRAISVTVHSMTPAEAEHKLSTGVDDSSPRSHTQSGSIGSLFLRQACHLVMVVAALR